MTTDSILLVDADPQFIQFLTFALEAGGYDVSVAATHSDATGLYREREFAAVVLSLDVHDLDAEALLRSFATNDLQPAVLLVAENFDIEEMVRLYDCGCVFGHRRKPLEEPGDLIRDLSRAIELRQVKRQNAYLLTQLRDARDELHELSEFFVQVEKAASLGWVAQGFVRDLEAALGNAPAPVDAPGFGRVMRAVTVNELQDTLDQCRTILADARPAMRGPRGEFRPIELAPLVSSIVRLHRNTLDGRGIDLELGPVDDTLVVNGDAPNLRLAITALIQNAAQSIGSSGRITLSVLAHDNSIHLNIRDNGPGMAEDVLARVFDPFFTTRRMGESTGLGLTVAKEIVHVHAGEIVLASVEGEGTTAIVILPAAAASKPTEALFATNLAA